MAFMNEILNSTNMDYLSGLIREKFLSSPHQKVSYQRGEVLFHQGERIEKIGYIVEGMTKCANYTNAGDEVNPHYFYSGEIFPEYLLMAGEDEYIYTLVAEKNTEILFIDRSSFKEYLLSDKESCQMMIAYMANRGLLAEKWKLCNCYGSLRSRIVYMLLEIYGVTDTKWTKMKDSQHVISKKLQISRTAYNQELIKLERENLILRRKTEIRIVDERKLEAYI